MIEPERFTHRIRLERDPDHMPATPGCAHWSFDGERTVTSLPPPDGLPVPGARAALWTAPALDRRLSPRTGWTRDTWVALADHLLAAVRPYASPGHARITPPGPVGGYGAAVDGLEGFARTFLLAGFRLTGEQGADPGNLAEWYAEGLATGTDRSAPDRWVRMEEHGQAKVEAASIALVLDLTRPWIWDRLDPVVQERLVEYLAAAVGDDGYPRINWVWFRVVVQTFLRSVGGPWSPDDIAEDLATHDTFARADGWLSDGPDRSFDHYVGWALHLYPVLWARMAGADGICTPARRVADVARLDRYLQDAVHLIGGDGAPLLQGRSLIYRFASAAPFWVGAMAQVPSVSPGLLRRSASGIVRHFVDAGAPDGRGLLTPGWHHAWPALAQSYSGPGSPYWASKGLLGIALPADHPAWTAPEDPLPVEEGDTLRALPAPGWLVAGTRSDGCVRVLNHGTDHAHVGAVSGDSPLYARLGYSTATAPLLDDSAWSDPVDGSVALVDAVGRASHRSGFRTLAVRVDDGPVPVAVGASRAEAHWLRPAPRQDRHGSGLVGTATAAGTVLTVSLVRGPWEVRAVRVEDVAGAHDRPGGGVRLRLGGWSVTPGRGTVGRAEGRWTEQVDDAAGVARVRVDRGTSGLLLLDGGPATAGVLRRDGASPLGDPALVPWLEVPAEVGAWTCVLVELGDRPGVAAPADHLEQHPSDPVPAATTRHDGSDVEFRVTWPDGVTTRTVLAGADPTL